MKSNVRFVLVCALLALSACSDDDSTSPEVTPVADGSAPSLPAPTTDSGTPTNAPASDAGLTTISKAIPLIDWVDDLVDHHTDDGSKPDTVDDKNISDNEDPTTFDRRF